MIVYLQISLLSPSSAGLLVQEDQSLLQSPLMHLNGNPDLPQQITAMPRAVGLPLLLLMLIIEVVLLPQEHKENALYQEVGVLSPSKDKLEVQKVEITIRSNSRSLEIGPLLLSADISLHHLIEEIIDIPNLLHREGRHHLFIPMFYFYICT